MSHDSIDNTVVGVGALMATLETFPSLVSGDPQCYSVLRAQLLQLAHNTICDNRNAFGIQAVHHGGQHLELLLNSVGEEVGINEDLVWRDEGGVVLEEESGGYLWPIVISLLLLSTR